MKLKINHLIYSNFDGTGRHFCASSFDKNQKLENEIEDYIGSVGAPDKPYENEWLFCQLNNQDYLYTRFITKGEEKDNGRYAQTYHCLILSQNDFNHIDQFPFLLNEYLKEKEIWYDNPPREYKLLPIDIELDLDSYISLFIKEIRTEELDKKYLYLIISSVINKKHVKLQLPLDLFSKRHEFIKKSFFCLPKCYRRLFSFSTYFHSFRRTDPSIIICIDHRLDLKFFSAPSEVNYDAIPFKNELNSFLNEPSLKTYEKLVSWRHEEIVTEENKEEQPQEIVEKTIHYDTTKYSIFAIRIANRYIAIIENARKIISKNISRKENGTLKKIITKKYITICISIFILIFFSINFIQLEIDYSRCKRLSETTEDPVEKYDAYIESCERNIFFAKFTNCRTEIERYREESYDYVYNKISKIDSCDNNRIKLSEDHLKKFPQTHHKDAFKRLIDETEECIAWKAISNSYYSQNENKYDSDVYGRFIKRIEWFLDRYKDGKNKNDALELKQNVLTKFDYFEFFEIKKAYENNSFEQANFLSKKYLNTKLFSMCRKEIENLVNWIKDHSDEKIYEMNIELQYSIPEKDSANSKELDQKYYLFFKNGENVINIDKIPKNYFDHSFFRKKEEKENLLLLHSLNGNYNRKLRFKWKLNEAIDVFIYDYHDKLILRGKINDILTGETLHFFVKEANMEIWLRVEGVGKLPFDCK